MLGAGRALGASTSVSGMLAVSPVVSRGQLDARRNGKEVPGHFRRPWGENIRGPDTRASNLGGLGGPQTRPTTPRACHAALSAELPFGMLVIWWVVPTQQSPDQQTLRTCLSQWT